MIKLLKKEIKLSYLPIVWFFPCLSCLLLIPNYPYCVGVSYGLLSLFINFNYASENRDLEYTAGLPIPRRDIVKAKIISGAFIEVMQIAVGVICGLIASFVLWGENAAGIDANAAYFGFVFLGFALFNIIFFPTYFGRGCKTGLSMIIATVAYAAFVIVTESIVGFVPSVHKALDGFDGNFIGVRIAVLIVGIVLYAASVVGSYFVSVGKFEKVSL